MIAGLISIDLSLAPTDAKRALILSCFEKAPQALLDEYEKAKDRVCPRTSILYNLE